MAAEPEATVSRRKAPVTRLDARRTTRSREQLLRDLVPDATASADPAAGSKVRIEPLEDRTPGKPAWDETSEAAKAITMDFGRGARADRHAVVTRSRPTEAAIRRPEPYIGTCRASASWPFAGARSPTARNAPALPAAPSAPQQPAVQVGPNVEFVVVDDGGEASARQGDQHLLALHIREDGQAIAHDGILPARCLHYLLHGTPGGANPTAAVA